MSDNTTKTPQHVAIIMDGNGRWAEQRGEERSYGHLHGVQGVREALKGAISCGVRYLTLYAFSSENWGRPAKEVDALMELLCKSILQEKQELQQQGVRLETIGDISKMSEKVQQHLDLIRTETQGGDKITLILALNYSARDEITRAVKTLINKVQEGEVKPQDINYDSLSQEFYTSEFPDPDLIVRTSGESRLSNFLLCQAAYSELYFMDVLWPDFKQEHFKDAINEYSKRNRRFGLV